MVTTSEGEVIIGASFTGLIVTFTVFEVVSVPSETVIIKLSLPCSFAKGIYLKVPSWLP